jgi:hypothetical protein
VSAVLGVHGEIAPDRQHDQIRLVVVADQLHAPNRPVSPAR